jgi:HK97 family phage major capsid protein
MPDFQTRAIEFRAADADGDAIPCTLSSEAPVDRGDYLEVLSHRPGDIDLTRAPLPLIVQHNSDQLNVGVVENVRIEGKTLKGVARFGSGEIAQQILTDVKNGIVRNLSVGYQLLQNLSEAARQIRFSWMPYECSVVSVPADSNAGFYRSNSFPKGKQMSDLNTQQQDHLTRSQRRAAASDMEVAHPVEEIIAIGQLHAARGGEKLAADFIRSGNRDVDAFKDVLLNHRSMAPIPALAAIGMTQKEARNFSILRAVRALSDPNYRDQAGFEIEASRAVARQLGRDPRGLFIPSEVLQRDMTVGTAGYGGHTVATNLLASSFIDLLRERSSVMAMGARVLDGLVGNVAVPRQTSGATAHWVAENGSATESMLGFDQVSLTPKSVTGFVDLSRKLLIQSSIDIEGLVRNDLAATLANAIDLAAIQGTGLSNQPLGILGTSGIGSVVGGTNGLAPTWAHIIELETDIVVANADIGALGYLTTPQVRGKLLQTEKVSGGTTGNFVWADQPNPLRGYRAAVSSNVPSNLTKGTASGVCSAIVFGNWNDLLIGMWGTLDLMVDPYTHSSSGAVRVVAFQDVDIGVRHPESFSAMLDALTS